MSDIAKKLNDILRQRKLKVATAESCTGGMIASAITDISGSSEIFDRGFVTYSNEAKIAMLGVLPATIQTYGAVSEQTATEMAKGALENSLADIAVSVTGIAGPTGGTPEKPVGLVYIGIANRQEAKVFKHIFDGGRSEVRQKTLEQAIKYLIDFISSP
jgi:nicotinamide-nucleotide amidase